MLPMRSAAATATAAPSRTPSQGLQPIRSVERVMA